MRAEALATRMFAGIGVRLEWGIGSPRPDRAGRKRQEIALRLGAKTPATFHPGAVAVAELAAWPSVVRVTILYDRVIQPSAMNREADIAFLAHVLAHEIAHALQGVARHSEEGLMKPRFTPQDRERMVDSPLPFTPADVELIRLAMTRATT
jgi:hypothetical protein